jgi:anti-sigma regulatory factor (Ser/Thr protein kinase)
MRYPHQSELVLRALPSAVPCARLHAKAVLHEWGLGHMAETFELIVSEIVTNAVNASRGLVTNDYPFPPTIQVWLSASEKRVCVKVWDGNNRMPETREPDLESPAGRGLFLVESLSDDCGAYRLEGGNGKVSAIMKLSSEGRAAIT